MNCERDCLNGGICDGPFHERWMCNCKTGFTGDGKIFLAHAGKITNKLSMLISLIRLSEAKLKTRSEASRQNI